MSETVFTKVDYDLGTLVKYIALGRDRTSGHPAAVCLEKCQGPGGMVTYLVTLTR